MIKSNLNNFAPAREKFKQTIVLLSHGYAAPQAFPDGKITVFPWDVETDNWVLEHFRKGSTDFIWDLCARQCDLNGCPIDKFVVGDVNTVLLVSRAITEKNVLSFQRKCPHCSHANSLRVTIPDELERVGEKTSVYPGYDLVLLPDSKDSVAIRPLVVGDMKALANRSEAAKAKWTEQLITDLVPIVAINETKPDTFDELVGWWQALHPADQHLLKAKEEELYPHLNTSLKIKCDKCLGVFDHLVTFDKEFFRAGGGL